MTTLYLKEQGSVLRRVGERLVVTKERERLEDVPIIHVEQVVVMGNIQVTTPAVALLLQQEVDVVFLSSRGKFRGRLMTTGSRFAQLRHRQLRLMGDERQTLAIAQAIIWSKLVNQAYLLQTLGAQQAARSIQRDAQKARQASKVESLRGHEGAAGARYFAALRGLIPDAWGFQQRVYHPPTDRVNAMLSLGYTLVLKDATAAVQLVGLDPFLGFFHAINYGRPSLVLDLMEPFRPLVDEMVVQIIHEGTIERDDFRPPRDGDAAVLLTDKACTRYFQAYERQIKRRTVSPSTGQRTSYYRCLELQARQLAQMIMGSRNTFQPLRLGT